MAQVGARGVAVTTQRAVQPYEFAYDHVSGELGSQEDLFMRKSPARLATQRALLSYVIMLVCAALSTHGAVSWYDMLHVANNSGFALHMWQCGMQL